MRISILVLVLGISLAPGNLVGHAATPPAPFRDCSDCPEMVPVPAARFVMGSPVSEPGRFDDEGPQRDVTIAAPFAVSATPITRSDYVAFLAATQRAEAPGCAAMNDAGEWVRDPALDYQYPGFEQSGDHPVVCVSWQDAADYAAWLATTTGQPYRLLSEAEFEYANRAGAATVYSWGDETSRICELANGFDQSAGRQHPGWASPPCDDGYAATSPVRSFPANTFGLFDMTGNVLQWVQDCSADSYDGAPVDGTARADGDCSVRVLRGGSWLNSAKGLRSALRDRDKAADRFNNLGFRVARGL